MVTEPPRSEREASLLEALRLARVGLWEWDVATDQVRWTPMLYEIWGQDPATFKADYEGYLSSIHPEDREAVAATVQRAFLDGEAYEMRHRVRRPDGGVRWIDSRGEALREQGRTVRMRGIARDVTDAVQAQEQFQALFENAPDGIILVDGHGVIRLANPQAHRLFGWPPGTLPGEPVESLVPAGVRAEHVRHRESFANQPRTRPMGAGLHLAGVRKDGSEFPVEISLSPVELADGTMALATIRDVSERQRAERLRQEAAEKTREAERLRAMTDFKARFINVAAHELKTPMTPIRLQVGILRDVYGKDMRPEHRRSIDVLKRSVDRLDRLIDDVLNAARVQADSLRVERVPLDLSSLAADLVETFEEAAREVGVRLTIQAPAPVHVEGDATRLEQVLSNLITNALKFTPSGGEVAVRVRA
ncbi:MAG TPA: PAS domain S-box protein, partial [Candidatus Thermoplasmatota archaeon]|nr:PAS domain S-box protein [Candidatus Thermoplasmatota archaeon]